MSLVLVVALTIAFTRATKHSSVDAIPDIGSLANVGDDPVGDNAILSAHQDPTIVKTTRRDGELGFALIGTVWLLLLCTALVAILMLRARVVSTAASQEAIALQREWDLDGAAESVAADLLINGPRSSWWQLPARGSVDLGATSISAAVTSEDGRLDLNDADPAVIEDALRGLGVDSQTVQAFLTAILARRAQGRLNSAADVQALLAVLTGPVRKEVCADDLFTIDSGLNRPDTTRASSQLARALGGAILPTTSQIRAGEALRIQTTASTGRAVTRVERIGVIGSLPVATSRRWLSTGCAG